MVSVAQFISLVSRAARVDAAPESEAQRPSAAAPRLPVSAPRYSDRCAYSRVLQPSTGCGKEGTVGVARGGSERAATTHTCSERQWRWRAASCGAAARAEERARRASAVRVVGLVEVEPPGAHHVLVPSARLELEGALALLLWRVHAVVGVPA